MKTKEIALNSVETKPIETIALINQDLINKLNALQTAVERGSSYADYIEYEDNTLFLCINHAHEKELIIKLISQCVNQIINFNEIISAGAEINHSLIDNPDYSILIILNTSALHGVG